MTNSSEGSQHQPENSKRIDSFLDQPGKTVIDILLWIPLHLPGWMGFRPFNIWRMLLAFTIIILLGIFLFVYWQGIRDYLFTKYPELKKIVMPSPPNSAQLPVDSTHLRIAYFFVNPMSTSEMWAAQDGAVQNLGFQSAIAEFDEENIPQKPEPRSFLYGKDAHKEVLEEMKNLYYKGNVRVFIVTMSEVVKPLRAEFKVWRDTIPDPNQRPILIATVTSAPKIADLKNGILRLYIRSSEEADNLAKYAYWKLGAKNAGVFYINDAYGEGGAKTFSNEFKGLGGNLPKCYVILKDQEDITAVISNWVRDENTGNACALVVGYGDMLKRTIEELDNQHFYGTILCVSTITNELWRPSTACAHTPLVTVVPERVQQPTPYPTEDYDVVRFFSKLTLLKALDCARYSKTTMEFITRWQTDTPPPPQKKDLVEEYGLSVNYLVDGDAIIKLKVEEIKR